MAKENSVDPTARMRWCKRLSLKQTNVSKFRFLSELGGALRRIGTFEKKDASSRRSAFLFTFLLASEPRTSFLSAVKLKNHFILTL